MRQSGRVDLRPLLFGAEAEADGPVLREGHDFAGQSEVPGSEAPSRPVGGPGLLRLVGEIVREAMLLEVTGELPGGKAWSEQPWWRVGLWEAFWEG